MATTALENDLCGVEGRISCSVKFHGNQLQLLWSLKVVARQGICSFYHSRPWELKSSPVYVIQCLLDSPSNVPLSIKFFAKRMYRFLDTHIRAIMMASLSFSLCSQSGNPRHPHPQALWFVRCKDKYGRRAGGRPGVQLWVRGCSIKRWWWWWVLYICGKVDSLKSFAGSPNSINHFISRDTNIHHPHETNIFLSKAIANVSINLDC